MPTAKPTQQSIDSVIGKNISRLSKPGVLTVRPGYEIKRDQLTGKQAIVATVHTKKQNVPRGEALPDSIGNIPVDVREASAHQRLRAHDPAAAALTQDFARPEEKEPTWPLEREMPDGKYLTASNSRHQKALAKHTARQPATTHALKRHEKKPQIHYVPAPGCPLEPVVANTTITAHASPDAGLVTLKKFLAGTQRSLVIGMYDFTSGPILEVFEEVLDGAKTLEMVLDNPAPNPTRNQTDTQTVTELDDKLGTRAHIARALVRSDTFASEWMFPYAYHIKVIVRDDTAFWISSGNLNNSNQPDLANPPRTEDRDWHVIIEHEQLAKLFGAYINNDFTWASKSQTTPPDKVRTALTDARNKLATESNPPPPNPVQPSSKSALVAAKTFSNIPVTITPLLTPDTLPFGDINSKTGQYYTNITDLISKAQHSLYIQLQYIESSSGKPDDYNKLLQAIANRIAAGVDVRLIQSKDYGMKWAEKMKAVGVDLTANIRMQPNVHNKGFVVDGQTVVVSSQNFSPAGIETNRDAGVIIQSTDIAGYFGPIFESDWAKAKPFVAGQGHRQAPRTAAKKKVAKKVAKKKKQ
jgi:phosphatidylserine/phosphatidylglycerophosphate/cardiolipin synthase-like enzyme